MEKSLDQIIKQLTDQFQNGDYQSIINQVENNQKKLNDFLDSFLKTDMVLDENILSKNEYEKALEGKRHFRDA